MFTRQYMQDRLNSMILTPEEVEAFKVQREQYEKTNFTLAAQEKLEAARQASLTMLKSLFAGDEENQGPKVQEHVFKNYFGYDHRIPLFGQKKTGS